MERVDPAGESGRRAVLAVLVTYLLGMFAILLPLSVLVSPYAVSVATGAILAVLCYPLDVRLRRYLPAWAAGLAVTLGVIVLVLVPISLLAVGAFRQGVTVIGHLSSDDAPSLPELVEKVRRWLPIADAFGTPEELQGMLKDGLTTLSEGASRSVLAKAQAIPLLMLHLVLVVLSTYFMLVDGRRLFHWVAGKMPLSKHIRTVLVRSFQGATNAVVLASVAAAGTQSLAVLLAFLVLRVPVPMFAAGAAFMLAWIPTVGTVPVTASAALYLYLEGSPTRAAIMVGIGMVVAVLDNVVRPMVLRGRKEMHPMVSLLAILGGLTFLGLPGVFIGPLLASMAKSVLELWPAVASYSGIAVSDAGDPVPEVPLDDERVPA